MPRRTKTQALGQHFLLDRRVLARILDASAVGKGETVCEAGTGNGILTGELCRRAKRVVSYEIDRALYASAKAALVFQNLELVNADLFRRDEQFFDVFVSNLPYSKSRDAVEWLATKKFNRAIVMVQKEFADKLSAKPGDPNYRAVSAIASYCFSIEQLFDVDKGCFQPPPLVESTVIRATLKHPITREAVKNVNRLFSQRNKRASTVAARLGVSMDFGGDRRVDQLAPEQIIALAKVIK
ncbi:MAG: rRNA adenine dimethyltransferase family protein [Nitrososphaera sp.]